MSAAHPAGIFHRLQFGFGRRLPVILQAEAAECGMACLAMILGFHGRHIDLSSLRRRYAVSLKGMTLRHLVNLAAEMKLVARALRVELGDLTCLRLPCVLHWGMNHYVVLESVAPKSIIIHDPARGRRRVTREEASREFTGVALELTPATDFVREKPRPSLRLRDLFRNTLGLKSALFHILLLSLGIELIAVLLPMASRVVVDDVVVNNDRDLLLVIALALVLLLCVQLALGFARSWAIMLLGGKISYKWSGSLFDHLSRLPLEYFEKRHVGDVVSRFGSLATIQKTMTTDLMQAVLDGLMSVFMAIMLVILGGWLACIVAISTVLNAALRVAAYRSYRENTEEAITAEARLQSHFIETVRGMASVKLLNLRERRHITWMNQFVTSLNARLSLQRADILFGRAGDFLSGTDRLLLLVLGAGAIIQHSMTLGTLVAFLAYRDQFAQRVANLIQSGFTMRLLNVQTDRLSDIVLTDPEDIAAPKAAANEEIVPALHKLGSGLSAHALSARYGENEPWVFRNVSISVPQGCCYAITGPSGCGKTTLMKVLMGLLPPNEGAVYYGRQNIHLLGRESYRGKIAGVMQEDGLFAGSIAQNISCFDDSFDAGWVQECAARAAILDDIRRMPMGFETLVGDMGSTLSGGQKQRIILARALYQRPEILFLDEATSHLDESTEARIIDALNNCSMTRIIIAHRHATIAGSDEVLALSN